MFVRNLILGEELPKEITTGYEQCQCDPKWIWIIEHEGKKIGTLVTAPAHLAVILIRLVMVEGADPHAAGRLLTSAFSEMDKRGYRGYMVWFGEGKKIESQLLKLVESSGGGVLEKSMSLCYGLFHKQEAA